jgi:hypothetical protein
MINLEKMIKEISQENNFLKYKEFKLNKYYKINDNIKLLEMINSFKNSIVYYNNKTKQFNNIGVIDINGLRYYDFDDDIYTMTNKGIDSQIIFTKKLT